MLFSVLQPCARLVASTDAAFATAITPAAAPSLPPVASGLKWAPVAAGSTIDIEDQTETAWLLDRGAGYATPLTVWLNDVTVPFVDAVATELAALPGGYPTPATIVYSGYFYVAADGVTPIYPGSLPAVVLPPQNMVPIYGGGVSWGGNPSATPPTFVPPGPPLWASYIVNQPQPKNTWAGSSAPAKSGALASTNISGSWFAGPLSA